MMIVKTCVPNKQIERKAILITYRHLPNDTEVPFIFVFNIVNITEITIILLHIDVLDLQRAHAIFDRLITRRQLVSKYIKPIRNYNTLNYFLQIFFYLNGTIGE